MKNNGFTTMELIAATAVLSSLVAAAVGGFYWYIPKAQVTDANALITSTQLELVKNIQKGSCTADGQPLNIAGKYGTLNVSGAFAHRSGGQCLTGCNLTYTFNANGVSKDLSGKTIVLNALHNMKLAHSASSTVPDKYNPFINQTAHALGENCAANIIQAPTTTDGVISGSEIGEAAAPPPTTPTPPVTPPTTPTPPVTPPAPTTPTLPGAKESENTITVGEDTTLPCSQGGYCSNCWGTADTVYHPNLTIKFKETWTEFYREWQYARDSGTIYEITDLISPIVNYKYTNLSEPRKFVQVWAEFTPPSKLETGMGHGEGWGNSNKVKLEFTHANGKISVIYMAICGDSH